MTEPARDIRRIKVKNLIPNEEAFKKVGFDFTKVDDGYEIISLPQNWKMKENCFGDYEIIDDKSRMRATFYLNSDNLETPYMILHTIVSIGVIANNNYYTCCVAVGDFEHKISNRDFMTISSFGFEESEFEKAKVDFFALREIFEVKEIYGFTSIKSDVETQTNLDVAAIYESFQEAKAFLDEKLPGWRDFSDPARYWE